MPVSVSPAPAIALPDDTKALVSVGWGVNGSPAITETLYGHGSTPAGGDQAQALVIAQRVANANAVPFELGSAVALIRTDAGFAAMQLGKSATNSYSKVVGTGVKGWDWISPTAAQAGVVAFVQPGGRVTLLS